LFFWGQAPRPPTGEGRAPTETPPLQSSQYLSPTFNLPDSDATDHNTVISSAGDAER